MAFRKIAVATLLAMTAVMGVASAQELPKKAPEGGFAIVEANGAVDHKFNVRSITHPSVGVYDIVFDQSTKNCAPEGTIQGDPGFLLPGYIVVSKPSNKTVQVNTYATLPLLATDYKFALTVTCAS